MQIPDPSTVTSWPQAVVYIVLVIAVMVLPSVLTFMGNKRVKAVETTLMKNNGGSSVRDALDRIEAKLDSHGERLDDLERPRRFAFLRR